MTDCIDGSDESDSACEEGELFECYTIKGEQGRLCSIIFVNNSFTINNVLRLNFALS